MQTQGIVPLILPVHVVAGVLALVFGYVALFAAKGARVHRKSGILFVVAMLVLSSLGALIAALNTGPLSSSVIAGLLTFYFVATALRTLRRRANESHWVDTAATLLALTVGGLAFKAGFDILRSGSGAPEMGPMFVFGVVAVLAALGDVRVLRAGTIQGRRRITRHLWRMCFAMWVAAASFFWGPRGRVPEIIYIPALLPIPVLLPVVVMLYWLWRILRKNPRLFVATRERYDTRLDISPKEHLT